MCRRHRSREFLWDRAPLIECLEIIAKDSSLSLLSEWTLPWSSLQVHVNIGPSSSDQLQISSLCVPILIFLISVFCYIQGDYTNSVLTWGPSLILQMFKKIKTKIIINNLGPMSSKLYSTMSAFSSCCMSQTILVILISTGFTLIKLYSYEILCPFKTHWEW